MIATFLYSTDEGKIQPHLDLHQTQKVFLSECSAENINLPSIQTTYSQSWMPMRFMAHTICILQVEFCNEPSTVSKRRSHVFLCWFPSQEYHPQIYRYNFHWTCYSCLEGYVHTEHLISYFYLGKLLCSFERMWNCEWLFLLLLVVVISESSKLLEGPHLQSGT